MKVKAGEKARRMKTALAQQEANEDLVYKKHKYIIECDCGKVIRRDNNEIVAGVKKVRTKHCFSCQPDFGVEKYPVFLDKNGEVLK